jgi:hypothetical protein
VDDEDDDEATRVAKAEAKIEELINNSSYSPAYARTIHAALQYHVDAHTSFKGLASYRLLDDSSYSIAYKRLSKQQKKEGAIDNHVHNQISKNDLHRIGRVSPPLSHLAL